ncbi:MAG TPA: hypothetical protein VER03_03490 [Bryobacteraceae bacterium]|nr:hypothetical protein [Bryobacteraceae bacterium]
MRAYVTNASSLLGASLTGALRWEGHQLVSSMADADVVFDTSYGVIYRTDRALARFVFAELLAPGDVTGTTVGDWLTESMSAGRALVRAGGACITDARDVALAMLTAAERGLSGEFDVVGPFYTFAELADVLGGNSPSRPSIAVPELGMSFRPIDETIADVVNSVDAPAAAAMVA